MSGLLGAIGSIFGGPLGGILGGIGGIGSAGASAQSAAVAQANNALMTETSQDEIATLNNSTQMTREQTKYTIKNRTASTIATMGEQQDSLMLSIQSAVNTLTKSASDMVKNG